MSEFLITSKGVVLKLEHRHPNSLTRGSCIGCYFYRGKYTVCPMKGLEPRDNRCVTVPDSPIWVEVEDE